MNFGAEKLKENRSARMIFEIISSAKEKMGSVLVWYLDGEEKVVCEMFISVIRKARNEILLKPLKGQLNQVLNVIGTRTHINVYIPSDLVFFQSEIKKLESDGVLTLSMPSMIAQVDRRKNLRVAVRSAMICDITFYKSFIGHKVTTQLFKKNCYDISTGGLSFILSKSELKFFKVGDIVGSIIIQLDEKSVELSGSIVNLLNIQPNENNKLFYNGYKVCIKFDKISPIYSEIMSRYIFKYYRLESSVA